MQKNGKSYRTMGILLITLMGIFMIWYPATVKKRITTAFSNLMEKEKNEKSENSEIIVKTIQTRMETMKRGKLFVPEQNADENFFHKDFFSEPWRSWENSYLVWRQAQNYFLCFLLLSLGMEIRRYYKNKPVTKREELP